MCATQKIEMNSDWRYYDVRIIHVINPSTEIVAGFRKKDIKTIDRLDFIRITDLCYKYKIIKLKKLKEDIDLVRELRNRLHIGGLSEIDKEYTRSDLEFCFNIARQVKDLVSK